MHDDDALIRLLHATAETPVADPCPEEESLAAYAEGGIPETDSGAIDVHLASCRDCRNLVVALLPEEDADPGAGASADAAAPAPPKGASDPWSSAVEEEFPRRFGPYTLVRALGRGGMGIVYEAIHDGRRRPEALKVLLEGSPALMERFGREVQAMANLAHPHIVPLYDSGAIGDEPYYTMPLYGGSTLAGVLDEVRKTGEFPPAEAACAVLDRFHFPPSPRPDLRGPAAYAARVAAALTGVADALATMHAGGVLHRDIKPANLLLDAQGRLLLADFGLVRWGDQRITRTGQMLGTPAFMSPEQFRSDGKEPDARADVYALGATLFEALTLRLPYETATVPDTIRAKLSAAAPSVRSLNGSVPEEMGVLVARCLERRREDRPSDAAVLRDELARFSRGERLLTRPVSSVSRAVVGLRQNLLPTAVAAGALLAAGLWYFSRPTLLSVASLPESRLWLDGKEVAPTPIKEFRVSPGEHEVRLVREGFTPYVRNLHLARGGTVELDRTLQPADPADPEALRILAAAVGLEIAQVKVEKTRSGAAGPPFRLLFPRGTARRVPEEVRLWAKGTVDGWRAILEPADGGEALASFELPSSDPLGPPQGERVGLELDPALRTRLDSGGSFRLRLLRADGGEAEVANFTVLGPQERQAVDARWKAIDARFPEGGPALSLLRIEFLQGEGLFEEAYEGAVALLDDANFAGRREPARAALAALDRAGLQGTAWWDYLVELHEEASR